MQSGLAALAAAALLVLSVGLAGCGGSDDSDGDDGEATLGQAVTLVDSFEVPKSPSGMFYDNSTTLLHVLCGTSTNGDHYLYIYTTGGEQKCFVTIPAAAGMSRVDGFYIVGDKAYIADSQGPIYAGEAGKLGGSVYQVDWSSHPCACSSGGNCTQSTVSWTPEVIKNWAIDAMEHTIRDGGTSNRGIGPTTAADETFRNSGIVVLGDYFFAINGVHPIDGSLTKSYKKSLVRYNMTRANEKASGFAGPVTKKWPFDSGVMGNDVEGKWAQSARDVDMAGLACGPDACASAIYIGDEYNYIYKLALDSRRTAEWKLDEWDCRSIVGDIPDDRGIEGLAFDGSYWYIGIQETAMVYKLTLAE